MKQNYSRASTDFYIKPYLIMSLGYQLNSDDEPTDPNPVQIFFITNKHVINWPTLGFFQPVSASINVIMWRSLGRQIQAKQASFSRRWHQPELLSLYKDSCCLYRVPATLQRQRRSDTDSHRASPTQKGQVSNGYSKTDFTA